MPRWHFIQREQRNGVIVVICSPPPARQFLKSDVRAKIWDDIWCEIRRVFPTKNGSSTVSSTEATPPEPSLDAGDLATLSQANDPAQVMSQRLTGDDTRMHEGHSRLSNADSDFDELWVRGEALL